MRKPMLPDNPCAAYGFKVRHRRDESVFRVIELPARCSLSDLHDAIQQAWGRVVESVGDVMDQYPDLQAVV